MKRKLLTLCLAATLIITTACSSNKQAAKKATGQHKTLEATYIAKEENGTGIEKWNFTKKGTIKMINIFTYTKEQEEKAMKISMEKEDENAGVPSFQLKIYDEDGKYVFTQMQNGNEIPASATQFELEEGDDGLKDTEPFEGAYTNKGYGITYRFAKDGQAEMETAAAYTITDGILTISTASGSASYPVKVNDDESKMTVTVEKQKIVLNRAS